VFAPLTQHQFDALACFAFNLGTDQFGRSGVLKRLNEGSPILAACAMELWRKAEVGGERIVVDALVRRRAAEKALFLTPDDEAWLPAPSHVLKPLVDTDAFDLIPLQDPAQVSLSLEGEAVVVTREGGPAPSPVAPDEAAFDEDPLDEKAGPARTAAEAVTARLSTIFQDPGEEPRVPPSPEPDFVLQPPEFEEDADAAPAESAAEDDELRGPDLFDTPLVEAPGEPEREEPEPEEPEPDEPEFAEPEIEPAEPQDALPEAPDLEASEPAETGAFEDEFGFPLDDDDRPPIPERRVIDDGVPYDFDDEPVVHAMPDRPEGGPLAVVMLATLGLVFFGGGAFWAFYARPMPSTAWLDPRLVGLFAGVAGALFISVAAYLLLQRLGRASEREARDRR
jgi:lysozyme